MYGKSVKQRKLIDAIEETDKILKENGQNGWKETHQNQANNVKNEINLKNHEKAIKNNNEIKENTNKNIENGKESPQKEEKDTNKKGVLHKKIAKQKKNEENDKKSVKESPDTEKIEQKITRLFQKNNDSSIKKKGRKWGKRKCLKPDFFQLEEPFKLEEKPEKIEEKIEENIVIPSKNEENPCLESDKTPNYKKILKDLWFCLDLTKKNPPLDNEISNIQCQIKEFLDKITQEFDLCKKNREHQDSLQIYIQGYGNVLGGIDYILKINENTQIYKRHFQYIHNDLKHIYCDFKNFIYLNYLKPELPQEKIPRNLGFFESLKENSSEKGKLSLELSEDFSENRFKKKFVVKMAQTFQSNYGIGKEKSQNFALKIHSSLVSESNSEHIHNKGIKLLKILKVFLKKKKFIKINFFF